MARLLLAAWLLSPVGVFAALTCPANGNNCARAVTATFQGSSSARRIDCSKFQQCTVIPATITSTITATVTPAPTTVMQTTTQTGTVTVAPSANQKRSVGNSVDAPSLPKPTPKIAQGVPEVQKRAPFANTGFKVERRQTTDPATTNCPASIPTYASACSGSSAYASACSCAGVTRSYSTLPSPVVTRTVTTTASASTVTSTAVMAAHTISPTFVIRIGDTGSTFVDTTFVFTSYQVLHYDSGLTATAGAASFYILDGLLYFTSSPTSLQSYLDGSAGYIFTDTVGDTLVPGSFGAFDTQAGGYLLSINVPGFPVASDTGDDSGDLVLAPPDAGYYDLPPLYAVFI